MKKIVIIMSSMITVIVIVVIAGVFYLNRGLEDGATVSFEAVDLNQIENGTYIGQYDYYRFSTTVEVTIENNTIVGLRCIDDVTFVDQETWDTIEARVLDYNTYQVDVFAGATVTSNSYLKAIENALKEATNNA